MVIVRKEKEGITDMADKTTIVTIEGCDLNLLEKVFLGYVSTGKDDSSTEADFKGDIDADGRFYIVRKGHESSRSMDYEARLTGKVTEQNNCNTVIEYGVQMSPVFKVCFIIFSVLCAALLTFALIAYFGSSNPVPLAITPFFVTAFIILLIIFIVKPDCRAVEKCLDTIVNEYAAVLEKRETEGK